MASLESSPKYLQAALQLRNNLGQWAAYESTGNCCVLAGPGSGKTKTLVTKLARVMAEDVRPPRGVACITFSNEAARELTRRLRQLGLEQSPRLFVGTVHSFCLLHLLLPFAQLAGLKLPYPLKVATESEAASIYRAAAEKLRGNRQPVRKEEVDRHRRVNLDRDSEAWTQNDEMTGLAETYEKELRKRGLIDFEDIVHYGQRLVNEHDWVLKVIRAKFPVLAVDEYQDLGVALDRIVRRLTFNAGVRLIAVGDVDQSVYGFTGANSELLEELSKANGVETIRLKVNYRSGTGIINVAQRALGKDRGYESSEPEKQASVQAHKCDKGLQHQAEYAMQTLVPAALAAKKGRQLGDIAVLYRNRNVGDAAAIEAVKAKYPFVRIDNAAPYRKVPLTSWVEDCAIWCAGGWKVSSPPLHDLQDRWISFHGGLSDKLARAAAAGLTRFLWDHRGDSAALDFVTALRAELLDKLIGDRTELADQSEHVEGMHNALDKNGVLAGTTKAQLGRRDGAPKQLNLLTLHSAKGAEYDVVIILGLDQGEFPSPGWMDNTPQKMEEARRLFYVGITRARDEVHLVYSGFKHKPDRYGRIWSEGPSQFLGGLLP
ncbi:ATP-dependent helicase [Delftia tsuruhatensis]|uniref:ATP-dependent helicase n=1 Tax=Delftia tsuruhatensis TaxID=180282 RepID=UPI0024447AAE|nr:ATP-dependent helicase [Delftia tsuruhatensis]MDH0773644.1 ATP-dependent helicase [Delftia tsuruhatensis]MDH1461392.1 ATP-dependent helicase [Delftia tsuruhatensis]MDH1822314.1 ATP-dependent helicase [Delftia tsuruhatensis]WGG11337.1 ATP-dependent helicase [Delftia tsuruhatensis]